MSASTLDTTKYNAAAANTVFDAVIDAIALLAWRQNVKAVVDQHATEIDLKLNKAGDTMFSKLLFSNGSSSVDSIMIDLLTSVVNKYTIGMSPIASEAFIQYDSGSASSAIYGHRFRVNGTAIFTVRGDGALLFNGLLILSGAGSPEGVKTAPVGSLYLNTSGGAGTTLYVKQSLTGNTGWIGK